MLLGKRPRQPIKRTTSMKGMTVDLNDVEAWEPSDPQNPIISEPQRDLGVSEGAAAGHRHRPMAMVSPRYHKSVSGDYVQETSHFLRSCGLCKRRLSPGRDIYMYRGDTAFCSQECREQQMKHDERKEKCSVEASTTSETIAAA